MRIDIVSPTTPNLSHALGPRRGELDVFVPAHVRARLSSSFVENEQHAIAIRWRDAPATARLSQQVSFLASLVDSAESYRPLIPDAPHTDVRLAPSEDVYTSLPLSPARGQRVWHVDALATSGCPTFQFSSAQ